MYAGYVDGRLLFAAGMPRYEIVDGTISEAVGSASSATIKLPPSNVMRDVPVKRASVISIRKDGAEVFRGSVVDTTTDLRGMRTYSIDSAMMWLADICKPPHTINAMAVSTYLGALVTQYNAGCLAGKQIKLGVVGASLPSITLAASEYKSMLDLAKEAASVSGGELRIRYADGAVYLDCLTSYDHRCSQTVELRKNLLGLTDEIDGADLVTRVYPVGKDGLTIEDVNGGQVYLVNAAAEGIYGRIDGTLQADTDDASALKATAASYLAQHSGLSRGIQVTAADLSAQDFGEYHQNVAQVLLTADVTSQPISRRNVENTFRELLDMNVIPIVNENDTVAVDELEGRNFGDNDTLSAIVASIINADVLMILTDIDGVYDKNPKVYPDAKRLSVIEKIDDEVRAMAGGAGSARGTGGMATKIRAAEIAGRANIPTYILSGEDPENLYRIFDGEDIGTVFMP